MQRESVVTISSGESCGEPRSEPRGADLARLAEACAPDCEGREEPEAGRLERVLRAFEAQWGDLSSAKPSRVWTALASTAALDLGAVRMAEPHLDALAILAQARAAGEPSFEPPAGSTWGVFAAERPDLRLEARPTGPAEGTFAGPAPFSLSGVKPWCSLGGQLSHAVVTAHTGEGRQAFAVDLRGEGVRAVEDPWPSRGLAEIPSGSLEFSGAPAFPVGGPGWYLERPGFAWGGIGVAACWLGGAVGLARTAARAAERRRKATDFPVTGSLLARLDAVLETARLSLEAGAAVAEGRRENPLPSAWALALRTRNTVFRAVREAQSLAREIAGPAALAGDVRFAKADADLTVYLAQHHGQRDEASLGAQLVEEGFPW
ncbi:acyl-CoA dehydrogenase family protein [Arthrobacter sp. UM1]|uniref:acyl-CoA dehydrogenase family protein n=1 Tax=Arthrobacter sp. UM1 TaxID=2766776 RepID=UPI001CF63251|nr:acyl-CoA dehydrogenase family protein [Arthrobacter sp. UM1]MCB4209058.1 hypothetical protein [Arthrobacter sp. UM1]